MAKTTGVHVWLALWKATGTIEAHVARSILQLQMCQSDFALLEALLQQGSLPVNTVGKEILLTSGSVTTAVSRLESRKLVQRSWSQEDRRVCLVELTEEGRALIEKASAEHAETMETAVVGLTGAERKILLELLKKLGSAAQPVAGKQSSSVKKEESEIDRANSSALPETSPLEPAPETSAAETGFAGFTGLD